MTSYRATADRRLLSAPRTEGVIARMVRLWIEHHQRMIDLGLRPH